jgi:Holliday junction resolvase RusA-like endonuclease
MIRFCVEGDPVSWRRPRVSAKGIFFNEKKHTDYQKLIKLACLSEMNRTGFQKFDAHIPLEIDVTFYFQKPKSSKLEFPTCKKDLDDHLKQIDALNGVLWADDGQIVRMVARKRWAAQGYGACAYFKVRQHDEI